MTIRKNRLFAKLAADIDADGNLTASGINEEALDIGGGITIYATQPDLPYVGNTTGDQAYVTANNRLYIWNGTGWYSVALINTAPQIISVLDDSDNTSPFSLSMTGDTTTITVNAQDSDADVLTYGVVTDSAFLGFATISQTDNVFTVTPLGEDSVSAGAASITFTVTDGANVTGSINTFSLDYSTPGQAEYTTPGTYSWTPPAGVFSVSVVAVGGGGGGNSQNGAGGAGGGGGGLGYKSGIPVVPGQSYTVVVGSGGTRATSAAAADGGNSYFIDTNTVAGLGGDGGNLGVAANGGSYVGDGGGNGGSVAAHTSTVDATGGGGAGGYSGAGGNGGSINAAGSAGSGGGGGGGGAGGSSDYGAGGGGVGIYGEGTSGAGGAYNGADGIPGLGGSGGQQGVNLFGGTGSGDRTYGGAYGGGGGGAELSGEQGNGGKGAVRIIWGPGRSYPSTNTADV